MIRRLDVMERMEPINKQEMLSEARSSQYFSDFYFPD